MEWKQQAAAAQNEARENAQAGKGPEAVAALERGIAVVVAEREKRDAEELPEVSQAEIALRNDLASLKRQTGDRAGAEVELRTCLERVEDLSPEVGEALNMGTRAQLATLVLENGDHDAAANLIEPLADVKPDPKAALPQRLLTLELSRARGEIGVRKRDANAAAQGWMDALMLATTMLKEQPPLAVMQIQGLSERLLTLPEAGWGAQLGAPVAQALTASVANLEEHVRAGAQGADARLVASRTLLAEVERRRGNFADAEDSIWLGIEVDPGPQAALNAMGLYARFMEEDDAALSGGGLPREEVVESLTELRDRMKGYAADAQGVDAEVVAQFEGDVERWHALASGARQGADILSELGEPVQGDPPRDLSGVVRQLVRALATRQEAARAAAN